MAKTEVMQIQKTEKLGGNSTVNTNPILLEPLEFTAKTADKSTETYKISANLISIGGESQVYHATSPSGAKCAAKIDTSGLMYKAVNRENRAQVIKFLREHADYKQFHIMPLLATGTVNIEGEDGFALPYPVDIFPYCPTGDLEQLTKSGKKFSYAELKNRIIPALCKALHAIHANNLIHRDIKPANLYELDGEIVVGDFGTAVFTADGEDETVKTELARRTIGYTAIEVTASYANTASDYFSLGCTLATLYKGEHPYSTILTNDTEFAFHSTMTEKGIMLDYKNGDEPLKNLIDALVRMNWTERPKHADIINWLADDSVLFGGKVTVAAAADNWQTPFKFSKTLECRNKKELVAAIVGDWEQGKRYLYNRQIHRHLQAEAFLQDRIDWLTESSPTAQNHDLTLSQFMHDLLDGGNLFWRGKEFADLSEISAYMWQNEQKKSSDKDVSANIIQMLKDKYLSWKMVETLRDKNLPQNMRTQINENLPKIRAIEELSNEYPNFAYYYAMFAWSSNTKQLTGTADEIFKKKFTNSADYFESAIKTIDDDYICGAIAAMGFMEQIKALKASFKTNSPLQKVGELYFLFEHICADKIAVRRHYLKYSPKAYLYWLQQNLSLYEFHSADAKNIKAGMTKVQISEEMALTELEKSFNQLGGFFVDFQKLFQGDFVIACLGLTKGLERHGEITATQADAFFLNDYLWEDVPFGFGRNLGLAAPSKQVVNRKSHAEMPDYSLLWREIGRWDNAKWEEFDRREEQLEYQHYKSFKTFVNAANDSPNYSGYLSSDRPSNNLIFRKKELKKYESTIYNITIDQLLQNYFHQAQTGLTILSKLGRNSFKLNETAKTILNQKGLLGAIAELNQLAEKELTSGKIFQTALDLLQNEEKLKATMQEKGLPQTNSIIAELLKPQIFWGIGEIVPFGGYQWRVLAMKNNQVLLLSEFILGSRQYNSGGGRVAWKDCSLRKYLNGEFYNKFVEKDKIVKKNIRTVGNTTSDSIFLLDREEVQSYFQNDYQRVARTKQNGNAIWWWLREDYNCDGDAYGINESGNNHYAGIGNSHGVRPALWINL
ncbi:MAG: DUF6273 domain-containing protein [Firmicutes bacterium]|nr:DUF6273 domain-containing protein [Bacillota bacterium]